MPKYRRGGGRIYRNSGKKIFMLDYYSGGRRVRESSHTTDRSEARRLLRERVGEAATGRLVVGANRVQFEELSDDLITDYEANSRKSLADVKRRIEKHIRPFFGGMRMQEIATSDVRRFVTARQRAGASNAEVNRELAALKRMFSLGLKARKIVLRPHIEMLLEAPARSGFLERGEFETILAKTVDYLRPPLVFAFWTGWRMKAEILPLEWRQVDLNVGTVRLDVGSTKNREGRLIYAPDEVLALLNAQWNEHLNLWPASPWVFTRAGLQMKSIHGAWNAAREAAEMPQKLLHDFRRTALRNMIRAGIPERVAMQMCGWKTRSVLDRYHIVSDRDLRDAADALGRSGRVMGTPSDTPTLAETSRKPVTH